MQHHFQNKILFLLLFHNSFKINKIKYFKLVAFLALFLFVAMLIIYIFILIFQKNVISTGYNGFLICYYNHYQRDQLYSLYSVLLSSYFHYLNITDFSDVMKEVDYINLIARYSKEFQNHFINFMKYIYQINKILIKLLLFLKK